MTDQLSWIEAAAKAIGDPFATLGALLAGFVPEGPLRTAVLVIEGLCTAIAPKIYKYYLGVLAQGAKPEGSLERQDYDKLRASLAGGNLAARLYAKWLTAFLDAVERFFGDAGMADRTLFPRAFGLKTPAPLWTAPAFDRCLFLALIYPIVTIFLIWAVSGHVGPAEAALSLKPGLSGWWRGLIAAAGFGFASFAIWRGLRAPGWKSFALINVAGAVPVAVVLAGAVPAAGAAAVVVDAAVIVAFAVAGAVAAAGAVAGAGAFAFAVALAVAFALIGAFPVGGGVAVVAPGAVAFGFAAAAVVAGAVPGAGAVAVGVGVAVVGAVIVAGVVAAAVPAAVGVGVIVAVIVAGVGAVAGAVAVVNDKAIAHRRQGIFLAVFLAAMFLLCLVAADLLSPGVLWGASGPLLLFLGLLTLINAPFDWASLGLTRALLRSGLELGGWWPYLLALADACLAVVIIALLALTMVIGVQTFDELAVHGGGEKAAVLPLEPLFDGIDKNPEAPEYWWAYALLLSSMIPSLINLSIGGMALTRGIPSLGRLLLRWIPEGRDVPEYKRQLVAIGVTVQMFSGAFLGIAAQALLAWGLIFHVMPWVGLDLLAMARAVAAFYVPLRAYQLFTGIL